MPPQRPLTFLQLRLNVDGLPGKYVQEHLGPYRYLDEMSNRQPKGIAAIGGWLKRRFLARYLGIYSEEHRSIAIACSGHCLIYDCELHLEDRVPRVHAGPIIGNIRRHLMEQAPSQPARLAFGLYCEVVSLFSDITLVFVPDFGGLAQVVEFLSNWLERARAKRFPACSYIILIHEERPAKREVRELLSASFAKHLRVADPLHAYSASDIAQMIDACFRLSDFTMHDLFLSMAVELDRSFLKRVSYGEGFKAHHYKAFLQAAISQYTQRPSSTFSFITASRLQYPIPIRLESSLSTYLSNAVTHEENVRAVASALVLDAYPPQMHRTYVCQNTSLVILANASCRLSTFTHFPCPLP